METPKEQPPKQPLAEIFDGGWNVFTVEEMDADVVAAVLKNSSPPRNSPHAPTRNGLLKAARDFCSENGNELLKAVELLESK